MWNVGPIEYNISPPMKKVITIFSANECVVYVGIPQLGLRKDITDEGLIEMAKRVAKALDKVKV
jgi:hypothetical protein